MDADDNGGEPHLRTLQAIQDLLDGGHELEPDALVERLDDEAGDRPGLARGLERYRQLLRRLQSADEAWHLRTGDRLGGFEIQSPLAKGGVGEVYRARQTALEGRLVAFKVLSARDVSPGDRRRFAREARLAAAVHHAHLVEVYDYGEEDGRGFLYYAMRLVEGPTLRQVLERIAGWAPLRSTRSAGSS